MRRLTVTILVILSSVEIAARAQEAPRAQPREPESGDAAPVQVRAEPLWALGDLPLTMMNTALDRLATQPAEAQRAVMQAAAVLELHAALGARTAEADRLRRQSEVMQSLARRIETRELLDREALGEAFAETALAAAGFYRALADDALRRGTARRAGHALRWSSAYLATAHTLAELEPTPLASRAIRDAEVTGAQLIGASAVTGAPVDSAARVLQDLGTAIRQAEAEVIEERDEADADDEADGEADGDGGRRRRRGRGGRD